MTVLVDAGAVVAQLLANPLYRASGGNVPRTPRTAERGV